MKNPTSKLRVAMVVTMAAAAVTFAPVAARANTDGRDGRANNQSKLIQPVQPLTVADNVVVTPGTQAAPAAPATAPTVVVPQQAPAPAAAPVAAPVQPAHTSNTQVVEHEHSYVGTIFISALLGGAAGALIGGALWYLNDDQTHAARIGYWAAGGVLVGTGIGVAQLVVQEGRHERAVASLPTDPAPTFRLALYQAQF